MVEKKVRLKNDRAGLMVIWAHGLFCLFTRSFGRNKGAQAPSFFVKARHVVRDLLRAVVVAVGRGFAA